MSEERYDAEIAPALARIAERCADLGMPFVATVEYAPGGFATSRRGIKPDNLHMRVAALASVAGANIDDLIIGIMRLLREEGLAHSSITLKQLGLEPGAADRVEARHG